MQKYLGTRITVFLALAFILAHGRADADQKTITGTVKISPALAAKVGTGGSLFIFARPFGQTSGPPAAVQKVDSPKFPQTFALGPEQAMMPGSEFKGPFQLTARYSPTGNAMQKAGSLEGLSGKKAVAAGAKGVNILIDTER